MVFSLLRRSFYWQNASHYHYISLPPQHHPPYLSALWLVISGTELDCLPCPCVMYCPWTRISGGSRLNGFEWTTQRARQSNPCFSSSRTDQFGTTCPLGTPSIFTGNNHGNLGDVSSALSRSVCRVCVCVCIYIYIYMYIYIDICIYDIVTTFIGIIMLWTVSKIGNMFLWSCGSVRILCCVLHGKTFLQNETICEFFTCLKLPCQRQ